MLFLTNPISNIPSLPRHEVTETIPKIDDDSAFSLPRKASRYTRSTLVLIYYY